MARRYELLAETEEEDEAERSIIKEGLPGAIAHVVLQDIGTKVFDSLGDHMLDTQPENNHVFALIKAVTRAYIKIRMHHLVKEYNAEITGKRIRKSMHKLGLFKKPVTRHSKPALTIGSRSVDLAYKIAYV
ncbi:transposable element p transposase-like protein [Plakobranchus ocellatus]|uniref:Transposable element p transposase-like protein n=1 Tax=Plakobranchus ocellatus TaxID=259542 RepID=A0AAV3Y3T0_9GAST|nr:transposable element p transposase-like protein [Plakobranchus ocellatus]